MFAGNTTAAISRLVKVSERVSNTSPRILCRCRKVKNNTDKTPRFQLKHIQCPFRRRTKVNSLHKVTPREICKCHKDVASPCASKTCEESEINRSQTMNTLYKN